ncbi:MAG: hypothetical protein CMK59_09175 [Proteobacteria bacterium]|nr:hypothetical protein [Pseudomonadota bacterium]
MNEDQKNTRDLKGMDPTHTIHHYDLYGLKSSSKKTFYTEDLLESRLLNTTLQVGDELTELDEETDIFLQEISNLQALSENPSHSIKLKEIIGKGGMGVVFLGEQHLPNRDVAVKRLINQTPILSKALLEEAMTMGALEHPNIIPVHSVHMSTTHGPEVIMKRVQGDNMKDLLGGVPLKEDGLRKSLQVLIQVCHAIEFAHSKGIIHRDIKPENIMIGAFGETYLLDWGIALHKSIPPSINTIVGTPAYMAPEMLKKKPDLIDERTDVFLLGATLHEFITGKPRYTHKSITEALIAVEEAIPYTYPCEAPAYLANLCNLCCSKNPQERPSSVAKVRLKLENYLSQHEAYKLRDAALEKLQKLIEANQQDLKSAEQQITIHKLFGETRFGLEQALRLAPNCEGCESAIQKTIETMLQFHINLEHYHEAKRLLSALPEPNPKIDLQLKELLALLTRRERQAHKLIRLEERYDRNFVSKERFLMIGFLGGTVFLVIIAAVIYDSIYNPIITPQRLLITTGTLPLAILVTAFRSRHTLLKNDIGIRTFLCLGLGSGCFVITALAGLKLGWTGNTIMLFDLMIVFLSFGCAYPAIRTAGYIAFFAFLMTVTSIIFPSWTHTGFILSAIVSIPLTLFDLTKEDVEDTDNSISSKKT